MYNNKLIMFQVDLITYGERYSELEMAIQKIEMPTISEDGEEEGEKRVVKKVMEK